VFLSQFFQSLEISCLLLPLLHASHLHQKLSGTIRHLRTATAPLRIVRRWIILHLQWVL
jgi:hypothetical protein